MFNLPFLKDKKQKLFEKMEPVYAVAPQMRDYHVLTKLLGLWLPHVMSTMMPHYESSSVNTDGLGLRRMIDNEGKPLDIESLNADSSWNIFVGGSTAFGVGSTSDQSTIPAYLNKYGEESWLNLGVIRHNINQSLSLFLAHHQMVPSIDRMVLFMGVNEIAQYLLSDLYPRFYGTFASWNAYFYKMNNLHPNDDPKEKGFQKGDVLIDLLDHDSQINVVVEMMRIALTNWKLLADARGAELLFVFQPTPIWMSRELATEEIELFSALDNAPQSNYQDTWSKLESIGRAFIVATREICDSLSISFEDSNELLDQRELDHEWLFVDRSHLTDHGAEVVSNIIREEILK